MHKLYISMALLMSLVLGTGFAISGNSVFAQSYNDQSYDDSSYSNDSYSKYKTQDKPYECQRGPFEGFFVSSVEFCKFDFDDKKDIDDKKDRPDGNDKPRFDLNFYVVTSTETLVPVTSDDPVEATATCNEGDQVTGGGFEVRDIGLLDTARPTADGDITASEPFPTIETAGAPEGWEAEFAPEQPLSDDATNTFGLTAYAVCFETPEINKYQTIKLPSPFYFFVTINNLFRLLQSNIVNSFNSVFLNFI